MTPLLDAVLTQLTFSEPVNMFNGGVFGVL